LGIRNVLFGGEKWERARMMQKSAYCHEITY
jgi:hypothetical protein